MALYPGEYALPAASQPGFPWWLQWQHFLNVFFMVLIVRSGLQVRRQERPPIYWKSRFGGSARKISINLWFHQALDVLWLANGVVFIIALFTSAQWMRIVPTSWEVFPNAISALLQYASLDWPTENGWNNYNSLQQLAYFVTVFLAAPAAAITGIRMSGVWPSKLGALNRLYPVEIARAVHFPVMIYFVAFVAVHVFLVFATGALRNLNHMYGGGDASDAIGLVFFVLSLAITVGAWVAARPIILASMARLFGSISDR